MRSMLLDSIWRRHMVRRCRKRDTAVPDLHCHVISNSPLWSQREPSGLIANTVYISQWSRDHICISCDLHADKLIRPAKVFATQEQFRDQQRMSDVLFLVSNTEPQKHNLSDDNERSLAETTFSRFGQIFQRYLACFEW